jgi:hypothetical protein
MKKLDENLSEIFDVEPIISTEEKQLPIPTVEKTTVDDDAEFARENIRSLIEKGNTAIDDLLVVAKASEHPRAYEVAANLIKSLSELNKDLMEIQKRKKDLSPQINNSKNINVDKAVFVGSTLELVKLLKNKQEE